MIVQFIRIIFIPIIIASNLSFSSGREDFEKEFKGNCLVLSKNCAEGRIKREMDDLSFVFRDVIYHYCLDLYHCTEGKRIVCHHVRKSESEYVEKSQRKRVLQQCQQWNIPVQIDKSPVPIVSQKKATKAHPRAKIRRVRKILPRNDERK